jgi:archaellum component FlaG (FlaF/FlaG flagellin family)
MRWFGIAVVGFAASVLAQLTLAQLTLAQSNSAEADHASIHQRDYQCAAQVDNPHNPTQVSGAVNTVVRVICRARMA